MKAYGDLTNTDKRQAGRKGINAVWKALGLSTPGLESEAKIIECMMHGLGENAIRAVDLGKDAYLLSRSKKRRAALRLITDIVACSESDDAINAADFMQVMFDRARAILALD